MNRRIQSQPTPPPEPKRRPPDAFAEARQLVRRIRRGDDDVRERAAKWEAERVQLLANAGPVAKAAALAMLALPTNEDHVLEPQPGESDFGEEP